MTKIYKVGLTGGIGTGKSIIAKIFQCLQVPIYDADSHARELMNFNKEIKSKVIQHFGNASYKGGKVNRDHISKKVFNNPEELQRLNAIVHPEVAKHFEQWCQNQINAKYLIKEAALLFETGSFRQLDSILLVTSPIDLRIERIKNRDPYRSEREILDIINRQWKDDQKIGWSSFIIHNDEAHGMVIPQVLAIHQSLLESAEAKLNGNLI